MEFVGSAMSGLCMTEEGSSSTRMGRKRAINCDDSKFKSKNLNAERRRRQKLSDRLLALRSIVPIITNMNKATIIEDAITHIEALQRDVKVLSDMLLEMEASSSEEGANTITSNKLDAAEEMKQCGIEEDVQVSDVDGNKLWIKIILEKKRGRFTRLIESMTYFGLELTDTTVTTSKGAILVSSCVEGTYGDTLTVPQAKELLLDIIKGI